jgi:hypothetical protein
MADRVSYQCPSYGDFIFYYNESEPSSCDSCHKWYKVTKTMIEIDDPRKVLK